MTTRRDILLGDLGILVCALLWGFSFWALQAAADSVTPLWILTIRFGITSIAMIILIPKKLKTLTKTDLTQGSLIGIALALAIGAQIIGVTLTTTGKTAFLTAGYVVIIPFCLWAVHKKFPGTKIFIAAAICMTGMGILSLDDNLSLGKGELAGITAAVFSAVHLMLIDRFAHGKDPLKLAFAQAFTSTIICGILALIFEPLPTQMTKQSLGALIYLGIFCTLIPYALQIKSQQLTTTAHASIIFTTESLFAVLIGVLWLGEPVTPRLVTGCAMIMIAILLTEIDLPTSLLKKNKKNNRKTIDMSHP